MEVILELLKLIDLFIQCAVKPRPSGQGYKAWFST